MSVVGHRSPLCHFAAFAVDHEVLGVFVELFRAVDQVETAPMFRLRLLAREPLDVRFDSRHVVHDELAMHGRLRRVQSISASVKVTPGSADIERTPASTSSTSGTGKRPARHFMMAASTEMSEAAPDFSIDCTPSSRVTRKTVAPCCTTTMLVGAARASAPSAVIIRNRWPSGETSYVPCLAGATARR